MKRLKITTIGFVLLSFLSCESELNINRDPDTLNPNMLLLKQEMPSATTGVATSMGSYYAIIGGIWSQFYTQSAVANQYKNIDNYSIGTSEYNGAFNSMYDALLDARNVKNKSLQEENWKYYLISSVIEVYGFQLLTDMYGAVPYTESLNTEILNPKYDDPAVIYDGLANTLKDALSKDLSKSSTGETPGGDDLVFGGDMGQWKRFANTLLLKVYLRQANVRPDVASAGVKELLQNGAEFLTTDAAIVQYIDQPNKSNPLYETNVRQLNVSTNLRASTTLYSYLNANNDPRLDAYYTSGPSQAQGDYDNPNGAAVAVVKLNATDPVYFISAAESYFLQAEAQLRYGSGDVKSLYNNGVLAAFNQFGLNGQDFITNEYNLDNNNSEDKKLEQIIVQKWVSFFPGRGAEAFIEQLRTGYPRISEYPQSSENYNPGYFAYSVTGTTGGIFPRRIVYPQTEISNNTSFPGVIAITKSQWYEKK